MNAYFITIISIGIVLIGISFVIMYVDKKSLMSNIKTLEDRKGELLEIISDAEQMVHELNRFSDYVVEKISESKISFEEDLKKYKKNVTDLKLENNKDLYIDDFKTEKELEVENKLVNNIEKKNEDNRVINQQFNAESSSDFLNDTSKQLKNLSKKSKIMMLLSEGYSEDEIAKRLNIGKGEIHLIVGVSR